MKRLQDSREKLNPGRLRGTTRYPRGGVQRILALIASTTAVGIIFFTMTGLSAALSGGPKSTNPGGGPGTGTVGSGGGAPVVKTTYP